MAFPSNTTLLDDFNRADQQPPGGPWAAGGQFGNPNALTVSSNALSGGGASKLSASFGPDVDFYYTIVSGATSMGSQMYLRVNPTTSSYTGYRLDIFPAASITRLFKASGGSLTQVGSNVTFNANNGDKVGLEVRGGTFRVLQNTGSGWTQIASWTDGSPLNTGGGQFGIGGLGGVTLDDLSGGDAVTVTIVEGSATLSGESSLAAAGDVGHEVTGASSLSAQSTLSATATVTAVHQGAATLTGQSTLTVVGGLVQTAAATLTAQSNLTGAGTRVLLGTVSIDGSSGLTAASRLVAGGIAALSAQSSLSAVARAILVGSATFSGQTSMTVVYTAFGAAALSAQSSLSATGVNVLAPTSVFLAGEADFIAVATRERPIPKVPDSIHRLRPGHIEIGGHGDYLTYPRTGRLSMPKTGHLE